MMEEMIIEVVISNADLTVDEVCEDSHMMVAEVSMGKYIRGKSAYEIWIDQGHEGTEEDFLEWLRSSEGEVPSKEYVDRGDAGVLASSKKLVDDLKPLIYAGL